MTARKKAAPRKAAKKSGWGGARPGSGAKLTLGEPLDQHTSLAYTATQRARWRAAATGEWVVMGAVGEWLVVRPVDAARLERSGYEVAR